MKALVTGIKPYLARLYRQWADHTAPRFEAFETIRTKKQLIEATRFNGNTGNYLVAEGAIEAVGREKATFVNFGYLHAKTRNPDYLAAIHSEFDCIVLVTANLLRSDYNAKLEAELFSRLDLPIIVLGIGCQRKRDLPTSIPEGTLHLLDVLRSKEHHIFARGSASADYLISQGLRRVWSTGCPSMFMRPENVVAAMRALKNMDWRGQLRIAFSGYLGRDPATIHDMTLLWKRQQDCNYVLQDEHLSYNLVLNATDEEEIYNDASGELRKVCSFEEAEAVPDLRMWIFFNTHQWRAMAAMHEATFGRRFHGVVAGLQAGVPGLMIAIDDRMREMLDQSQLPYIDLAEWNTSKDKMALIAHKVSSFDADRFCEHYLSEDELFRKRMADIGLG